MKVKGISIFEDLLTESELAVLSNLTQDVMNADSSTWLEQMDKFLDLLIDDEAAKLSQILDLNELSPGMAVFLDEKTVRNVLSYVKYTKGRLDKSMREFQAYARSKDKNDRVGATQTARNIIVQSKRLQTLNQIYKKIHDLTTKVGKDPYSNQTLKTLLEELNVQHSNLNISVVKMSKDSADAVTPTFASLTSKADDEKINVTQKAVTIALGINSVADTVKDEPTKSKSKFYANTIFDSYVKNGGSGEFFKKQYHTLKDLDYHYLDITERIEKLRKWDDEPTFDVEVKKIITSITSTGKVFSETVINHLTKRLADAIAEARERMSLKKTSLTNAKGSRYVFEIRLPLYRSVPLPVTAKQMAEDSFLNRATDFLGKLGVALPGMKDSEWDLAARSFGETVRTLAAPVVKSVAGKVGHKVNGKEGERTGHSVAHSLFKDKYLREDMGGAPGLSMQVPSSVSSEGPIVPPTPTSFGSGDKFSPDSQRTRYKTRKRKK